MTPFKGSATSETILLMNLFRFTEYKDQYGNVLRNAKCRESVSDKLKTLGLHPSHP